MKIDWDSQETWNGIFVSWLIVGFALALSPPPIEYLGLAMLVVFSLLAMYAAVVRERDRAREVEQWERRMQATYNFARVLVGLGLK